MQWPAKIATFKLRETAEKIFRLQSLSTKNDGKRFVEKEHKIKHVHLRSNMLYRISNIPIEMRDDTAQVATGIIDEAISVELYFYVKVLINEKVSLCNQPRS